MTLVAAYGIEHFAILFGDLLCTGTQSKGRTGAIHIPTQGDVTDFFGESDWGIIGLRQKVNIVSPNCALAWAGEWLGARMAIGGLRRIASTEQIGCRTLIEYIDGSTDPEIQRATLVGFIFEDGVIHRVNINAKERDYKHLGSVVYDGSSDTILDELDQYLGHEFESLHNEAVPPGANAIAKTCMLGGFLLYSEFSSGHRAGTLLTAFGGGYEMVYFSDGEFRKLPEITFIFREAHILNKVTTVSDPLLVLKQKYNKDHLFIRSVQFEHRNGTEVHTKRDESFTVRPMFDVEDTPDLSERISLQSKNHCHLVSVIRDGSPAGVFSMFSSFGTTEPAVQFIENRNEVIVTSRVDTLTLLAKGAEHFRKGT